MSQALKLTCIRCIQAKRGPGPDLTCPISSRHYLEHVAAKQCPAGKYETLPAGLAQQIPADFDPEMERRRLKAGGCCGSPAKS